MPLLTMASATLLIRLSLMLQPNLFQLFQPMGGVRARPLSSARAGAAEASRSPAARDVTMRECVARRGARGVEVMASPRGEMSCVPGRDTGVASAPRKPAI